MKIGLFGAFRQKNRKEVMVRGREKMSVTSQSGVVVQNRYVRFLPVRNIYTRLITGNLATLFSKISNIKRRSCHHDFKLFNTVAKSSFEETISSYLAELMKNIFNLE